MRNHRQQASSTASQTQTETNAAPHPPIAIPIGTLRLRATAAPNDTRVRWAEDVIDNEGLGRKSSKSSSFEMSQLFSRRISHDNGKTQDGRVNADVTMTQFAAFTTRPTKWANHRLTPLQIRRHRTWNQKAAEVMTGEREWEVRGRGRRKGINMMEKGDLGIMEIGGRERDGMRMRASPR